MVVKQGESEGWSLVLHPNCLILSWVEEEGFIICVGEDIQEMKTKTEGVTINRREWERRAAVSKMKPRF